MAYIKTIDYEDAEGRLKEIYDKILDKRGGLAEVYKIQSLNPETMVHHLDLYLSVMFSRSPLKRYQREMIAVIVSKSNHCHYCVTHHGTALNHFWKDDKKLAQLVRDYTKSNLSQIDLALCEFAETLTLNPGISNHEKEAGKLINIGLDDRMVLDTTLIVSYFNFVNRMVLGLGANLEESKGAGFYYDE